MKPVHFWTGFIFFFYIFRDSTTTFVADDIFKFPIFNVISGSVKVTCVADSGIPCTVKNGGAIAIRVYL